MSYCDIWLTTVAEPQTGLLVLGEQEGSRAEALPHLCDSVADPSVFSVSLWQTVIGSAA